VNSYFHSVTIQKELCKGCTNCIKHCPTEAIRVREGEAKIINERCIDCGECIRICPQHAKLAITDDLEQLSKYKFPIALPAPSLYAQFDSSYTVNQILTGLLELGFYRVYEVAYGAEFVSRAINYHLKNHFFPKPAISSACPAVLRLIQVKFPELINNLIPIKSPMETTALIVREIMKKEGYSPEQVGIFFISPCAAKVTAVKNSLVSAASLIDGVISISSIYGDLLSKLKVIKDTDTPNLRKATGAGLGWAITGGESRLLKGIRRLNVDGITNVNKVFEEVVMGKLKDVDFIEGLACTGGCVGGPLTVENPFMAKERIHCMLNEERGEIPELPDRPNYKDLMWEKEIKSLGVLRLDDDIVMAMQKMEIMEILHKNLPGLDCGSCGAPTCRALAEDIVRGQADEVDCIFKLREKVTYLAEKMVEISSKMPPSLGKKEKE
jgi:iron only hydrogenase large subunit-like protein